MQNGRAVALRQFATVLDEVMSKVSGLRGIRAVTAELSVKYLRPVRIDQDLVVEGFEVKHEGRNIHCEGEIRSADGEVLARGSGRFVEVDREKFGPAEGHRF